MALIFLGGRARTRRVNVVVVNKGMEEHEMALAEARAISGDRWAAPRTGDPREAADQSGWLWDPRSVMLNLWLVTPKRPELKATNV